MSVISYQLSDFSSIATPLKNGGYRMMDKLYRPRVKHGVAELLNFVVSCFRGLKNISSLHGLSVQSSLVKTILDYTSFVSQKRVMTNKQNFDSSMLRVTNKMAEGI